MIDITKCADCEKYCKDYKTCYRYLASDNKYYQSYAYLHHNEKTDKNKCKYYQDVIRSEVIDKIKELETELEEANENAIWYSNRFKSVERNNRELKKQLEELELQNFNLREDIIIKKIALPNKEIKDKTFYDLYDMLTYEDLLNQQKAFINFLENEKLLLCQRYSAKYEEEIPITLQRLTVPTKSEISTIPSKYKFKERIRILFKEE